MKEYGKTLDFWPVVIRDVRCNGTMQEAEVLRVKVPGVSYSPPKTRQDEQEMAGNINI